MTVFAVGVECTVFKNSLDKDSRHFSLSRGHIDVCRYTSLLVDIWAFFLTFGDYEESYYKYSLIGFCVNKFLFLIGKYQGVSLPGYITSILLTLQEIFKRALSFYILPASCKVLFIQQSCQHLVMPIF